MMTETFARMRIKDAVAWSITIVAIILASVLALPTVAHAASIKYVDDVSSLNGQSISTGIKPVIAGGEAYVTLAIGTTTIVSYRPAPGYTEYGRVTTYSPYMATHRHQDKYNAASRCYWYAPNIDDGSDGYHGLNCWYFN